MAWLQRLWKKNIFFEAIYTWVSSTKQQHETWGDWEILVYASSVVYEIWRELSPTLPRRKSSLFLDYSAIDNFISTSKINFSPRKLTPTTEKERAWIVISYRPYQPIKYQNKIGCTICTISPFATVSEFHLCYDMFTTDCLKPIKEAQRTKNKYSHC